MTKCVRKKVVVHLMHSAQRPQERVCGCSSPVQDVVNDVEDNRCDKVRADCLRPVNAKSRRVQWSVRITEFPDAESGKENKNKRHPKPKNETPKHGYPQRAHDGPSRHRGRDMSPHFGAFPVLRSAWTFKLFFRPVVRDCSNFHDFPRPSLRISEGSLRRVSIRRVPPFASTHFASTHSTARSRSP